MIKRNVQSLAFVAIALFAAPQAWAQMISPVKAQPQAIYPAAQETLYAAPTQAVGSSLAPTPALAPTPTLLTTAPAVSYPSYASPQGSVQSMVSPQFLSSPQASGQLGGPSCACYYPQGRCPFPSGNCAYPQGNCVAPAGSCVGGPCIGSPQATPQVYPQAQDVSLVPLKSATKK